MEYQRAMLQIDRIHAQLLKTEVFRGYRAWPTALTGLIALGAAVVQVTRTPPADATSFCWFWIAVALGCGAICATDLVVGYQRRSGSTDRRRTVHAVLQFAPAVAVGAAMTAILMSNGGQALNLLPGLWALLYALGLFASRLHLPRAVGWVALGFLVGGLLLLAQADGRAVPSSLGMGITFGLGQLALAAVFYTQIERGSDAGA